MTQNRVIAIDGTAASGKGTLARKLAAALDLPHLDTGKLYRYVGFAILTNGDDPAHEKTAVTAALTLRADMDPKTLMNPGLMSDEVGQAASKVAAIPGVRAALFELQRHFAAQPGGAILDGRDIGTVICPDAALKLYVDATPEIRAERRHKELQNRGLLVTYDAVLDDMRERDARDTGRAEAPLKPADDAVIIDTTQMNADEAFDEALKLARQRLGV
ncbi:MAG: (d)CMP kinase [Alphaproteobacteria bacterium]|nr:(d)CMP kinase [Alphaproteobacteria bacterium]